MGGDPIERRIAPSGQWGYQYGGARRGGGFSPRGAAEMITATLQDGARGDGHAPLRGDTSVTPEQASAAEDAYIARIRALQERLRCKSRGPRRRHGRDTDSLELRGFIGRALDLFACQALDTSSRLQLSINRPQGRCRARRRGTEQPGRAGHTPSSSSFARPLTGLVSASCRQIRCPRAVRARRPRGRARALRSAWSRRSRGPTRLQRL
jgi:hypothetical protein